jgi:hypothetical protein
MSVAYHPQQHFAHELAKQYGRGMIATNSEKKIRSKALYTSRILKAGALIGDTKTLLSHWDVDATVDENVTRIHRDNVFGKASRSRVEDILAIFRRRLSEREISYGSTRHTRPKKIFACLFGSLAVFPLRSCRQRVPVGIVSAAHRR